MEDLELIVEQSEEVAEESEKETTIELATIVEVLNDGVTLTIDGNDSASSKHYKANTGIRFKAGDRVIISKTSGSYVVEFPIGSPNSNLDIPNGGSSGQVLQKNSNNDFDVKWGTIIPSGGTQGQVLTKRSGSDFDVTWSNASASTDRLVNGNYQVILDSNLLKPYTSGGVSLGSQYNQFKDLYCNGSILLGASYSSSLGFFGQSPISKQRLSDSATLSDVINGLRNYGLFSAW